MNRQCFEAHGITIIHYTNNMIHATYMSSEKEAALDLPQLGLTFLANSNSWNANGKLQNCEADAQEY